MTVRDSAKHTAPHHAAAVLSRVAVVVVAAYIAAQMMADIASLKIGVVAGLAVDMGTFVYPVTFTLRDLVHKTLGKRNGPATDHRRRRHQSGDGALSDVVGRRAQRSELVRRRRIQRHLRPAVAHRLRLDPRRARQRTGRHRDLSPLRQPRHHPFPVAACTGQQLSQRTDRQPDLRPDRVLPHRLSRRATRRLLGRRLGDLPLQSTGEVRGDASEYADDLSDAGSGLG